MNALEYLIERGCAKIQGIFDWMHVQEIILQTQKLERIANEKTKVKLIRRNGHSIFITRGYNASRTQ